MLHLLLRVAAVAAACGMAASGAAAEQRAQAVSRAASQPVLCVERLSKFNDRVRPCWQLRPLPSSWLSMLSPSLRTTRDKAFFVMILLWSELPDPVGRMQHLGARHFLDARNGQTPSKFNFNKPRFKPELC